MDTDTRLQQLEDQIQKLTNQPTYQAKQQLTYPLDYVSQQIIGGVSTSSTTSWLPGDIKISASSSTPTGWLFCDGAAISRTTYAALFSAIGTAFGSGDGSTTFNIPNMARKVPMGSGGSGTSTIGAVVGNTGGEEDHHLTINEMPPHSHDVQIQSGGAGVFIAVTTVSSNAAGFYSSNTTKSVGGDQYHNTIQPSVIYNYYIKT